MLKFEGIVRSENPCKRTLQRGCGTRVAHVVDAFKRGNKAFSRRSRAFPEVAPLSPSSHSCLCRAFPRHCRLCSSVRCSSAASGLSATGPRCQRRQAMRTLGRRSGVTVKYENGNVVDYNKAAGRCADWNGCSIRSVARGAPPVSARGYGLLGSFTVGTLRPRPTMPPSITPSKGAASKARAARCARL
jgi:hypothetical protein